MDLEYFFLPVPMRYLYHLNVTCSIGESTDINLFQLATKLRYVRMSRIFRAAVDLPRIRAGASGYLSDMVLVSPPEHRKEPVNSYSYLSPPESVHVRSVTDHNSRYRNLLLRGDGGAPGH